MAPPASKYQELIAWQRAEAFKEIVVTLLEASPAARNDWPYRNQLLQATQSVAANIAEGFLRDSPGDFRRHLAFALGSLGEAEVRLRDGIRLGYFQADDCAEAFRNGRRCAVASRRLRASQLAFMK